MTSPSLAPMKIIGPSGPTAKPEATAQHTPNHFTRRCLKHSSEERRTTRGITNQSSSLPTASAYMVHPRLLVTSAPPQQQQQQQQHKMQWNVILLLRKHASPVLEENSPFKSQPFSRPMSCGMPEDLKRTVPAASLPSAVPGNAEAHAKILGLFFALRHVFAT